MQRQRPSTVSPRVGSRLDLFIQGKITVEDLTEEELLTGILNDKNGARSGRPPNFVPREFHTAVVRRVQEIVEEKFRSAVVQAAENLVAMGTGATDIEPFGARADPTVLKAAQYIVERVVGKLPDKVEHSGEIKSHEKIAVFINRKAAPADEEEEE